MLKRSKLAAAVAAPLSIVALVGCGEADDVATGWDGSVDTLSSGQVVVHNASNGLWAEGEPWQFVEEARIGTIDGAVAETFDDIRSIFVDDLGQLWVLDGGSAELRVFDSGAGHVMTVGGRGSGPGEYSQPMRADYYQGSIWVMDPGNARLTILDEAGRTVEDRRVASGITMFPWPGGFDREGHYYVPAVRFRPQFSLAWLIRHDGSFTPLDTIETPSSPVQAEEFAVTIEGRVHDTPVPFQGVFSWEFSPRGHFIGLRTDHYRLFELDSEGDTLRVVTNSFEPVGVSEEERAEAITRLEEFVAIGGEVDYSRIPENKPPVDGFFVDDADHVWVRRSSVSPDGRWFDVLNPTGQRLGSVKLPIGLRLSPAPIVSDGRFYGVVRDELGVEYVVMGRVS